MTWRRMVSTQVINIAYPESVREAMNHFIGRKEFGYPDEDKPRKVKIVEIAPAANRTDGEMMKLLLKYGEKGNVDHLVYVLDSEVMVFALDMPGMARMDRPFIDVVAPGLTIPVACENAEIILDRLMQAELTKADGFEFYAVPFFYREFVFGAGERPALIAAFEKIIPEAVARADAYDKKYDEEVPGGRATIAKMEAGTHAMGPQGLVELPGRMKPS